MSEKAPLFTSSLELYAHAVELYATKQQKKFKFAILHLANAVELLLKDALVDLGESIYKENNPKETVTIWTAVERLGKHGAKVPRWPQLELLIDDRNTMQHRFGFPDERTAFYYIDEVSKFLKEFLNDRYSLDFADIVSHYLEQEHLPLIGLTTAGTVAGTTAKIKAIFELAPSTAILEAFNDLGQKLALVTANTGEEPPHVNKVLQDLIDAEYLAKDTLEKFQILKKTRNSAVHGQSEADWGQAMELYLYLATGVERAIKNGYTYRRPPPGTPAEVAEEFALAWSERATPEELRRLFSTQQPYLPKEIDAPLLRHAESILGPLEGQQEARKSLREGFWKVLNETRKSLNL